MYRHCLLQPLTDFQVHLLRWQKGYFMSKVFAKDYGSVLGLGIFNGETGQYVGYATDCKDTGGITEVIANLADEGVIVTVDEVHQALATATPITKS